MNERKISTPLRAKMRARVRTCTGSALDSYLQKPTYRTPRSRNFKNSFSMKNSTPEKARGMNMSLDQNTDRTSPRSKSSAGQANQVSPKNGNSTGRGAQLLRKRKKMFEKGNPNSSFDLNDTRHRRNRSSKLDAACSRLITDIDCLSQEDLSNHIDRSFRTPQYRDFHASFHKMTAPALDFEDQKENLHTINQRMVKDYSKVFEELEMTKAKLQTLDEKYQGEIDALRLSFSEEVENLQIISSSLMKDVEILQFEKEELFKEVETLFKNFKKVQYQIDLQHQNQEVKISLLQETLTKKNAEIEELEIRNKELKGLVEIIQGKTRNDLRDGHQSSSTGSLDLEALVNTDMKQRYEELHNELELARRKLSKYEQKVRVDATFRESC